MELNCSIFDAHVTLDKDANFSKEFHSATGRIFIASTLAGEPVLTISPKGEKPVPPAGTILAEHVARLPIHDMLWNVEIPSTDLTLISIRGEWPEGIVDVPQTAISVGGEKPDEADMSKIKLGGTQGSWLIEPDRSGKFLDLTYKSL